MLYFQAQLRNVMYAQLAIHRVIWDHHLKRLVLPEATELLHFVSIFLFFFFFAWKLIWENLLCIFVGVVESMELVWIWWGKEIWRNRYKQNWYGNRVIKKRIFIFFLASFHDKIKYKLHFLSFLYDFSASLNEIKKKKR